MLICLSCSNQKIGRLNQIAVELLEMGEITDFRSNRNSPTNDVVNIGTGLYGILSSKQTPINSIKIEIQKGDFFKENMGVTHSILCETNKSRLGLRMRYDKKIDKFHIVGYTGKID